MKKRTGGREVKTGTAVSLARTAGLILDGVALEPTVTTVWYLVCSEKDATAGGSMEGCLKSLTEKLGQTEVELAMLRDETWEAKKRMMKSMACLKGVKIAGYKDKKTSWSQVVTGRQTAQETKEAVVGTRREAIIVAAKEKEYSEALKEIRSDLAIADVRVTSIRKTRAGDILVETKGTTEEARKLRAALASHGARTAGGKTPVVIRGMDALTTKQEILGAVELVIGTQENVDVDMWITYGDTRAARVSTSKEAAAKLVEAGAIRVGSVWGKIKHGEQDRCYRCWGEGHKQGRCKGPDRRSKCFRCGEEGHQAAHCEGEEQCLTCKEKGHRTGAACCKGRGEAVQNNFQDPPLPGRK